MATAFIFVVWTIAFISYLSIVFTVRQKEEVRFAKTKSPHQHPETSKNYHRTGEVAGLLEFRRTLLAAVDWGVSGGFLQSAQGSSPSSTTFRSLGARK